MNDLGKRLAEKTKQLEQAAFSGSFRPQFHLAPPTGWMNDPNGLCQYNGIYHVFFQYSPEDAEGSGMKNWGHYSSPDLINWEYRGAVLFPDEPIDKDGVYSGSALIREDGIYLYYTGNVKEGEGFDYTYEGRGANTILVVSPDGKQFGKKELLMDHADYPQDCTCHVRDPKVWKWEDRYYMVQGARKIDPTQKEHGEHNDIGEILVFTSEDARHWQLCNRVTTPKRFGYMWECPDYFTLSQGQVKILSVSPQGVPEETYRYQNIFQSGYFQLRGDLDGEYTLSDFVEWDRGFDFYAPQTFQDESGRRVLIGWAGIPDPHYDNQPTIDEGWQHCLTMPREIRYEDGKIKQYPVGEMRKHRDQLIRNDGEDGFHLTQKAWEWQLQHLEEEWCIRIADVGTQSGICLQFHEGVFEVSFFGDSAKEVGRGRTARKMLLQSVDSLSIYYDVSIMEMYLNGGELVFTTRFYPTDSLEIMTRPSMGTGSLWGWK